MQTLATSERPVARRATFPPDWWVGHGDKMVPDKPDFERNMLVIRNGEVATLTIQLADVPDEWRLIWEVHHIDGSVRGQTQVTSKELEVAFGLKEVRFSEQPAEMADFANRYGAHASVQGRFIRFGNYLNIPHPGAGAQGDPNISVFISNEIRDAVRQLLASVPE